MRPQELESLKWLAENPGIVPRERIPAPTLRDLMTKDYARPSDCLSTSPEEMSWRVTWAGQAMLQLAEEDQLLPLS